MLFLTMSVSAFLVCSDFPFENQNINIPLMGEARDSDQVLQITGIGRRRRGRRGRTIPSMIQYQVK